MPQSGIDWGAAGRQVFLGNYTDDVTWVGTAGQVALGLTGIDFVADLRDLSYDLKNWEWSWSHSGHTLLDGVGLVPLIGAVKNADEVAALVHAARGTGIVASNGTRITGLTRHGVNRAIGDAAERAGTRPQAILDALKNPKQIVEGVDSQGRPFQIFHGTDARVIVNPQTGQIVSTNPLSVSGAL